eukprot:COSAG02_NODE_46263_length_350_cov_0.916335_1_plen_81_part_00
MKLLARKSEQTVDIRSHFTPSRAGEHSHFRNSTLRPPATPTHRKRYGVWNTVCNRGGPFEARAFIGEFYVLQKTLTQGEI